MEKFNLSKLIVKELHNQMARTGAIYVGVSARHIHLKEQDVETLFGKGYKLNVLTSLLEPGEFAAKETLAIAGPKMKTIQNVRILGPLRSETQVELSLSDCIPVGLNPPVRRSGDLAGSSPITLIGPKGAINLEQGCIRANRHIHLDPETAEILKLKDNDVTVVKVDGVKSTVLGEVQVRIKKDWISVIHLDTDDANAADLKQGDVVWIAGR